MINKENAYVEDEQVWCEWRIMMLNLVLFINSFLSYLLVFVIIVALVIVACILGVKWRKSADAKAAVAENKVSDSAEDKKQ